LENNPDLLDTHIRQLVTNHSTVKRYPCEIGCWCVITTVNNTVMIKHSSALALSREVMRRVTVTGGWSYCGD
jgi:hypothetical protein